MESYFFQCPHEDCKLMIEVAKGDINCKIFRHGVFKDTMKFINPHSPQNKCQEYKEKDLIYGCGKPFFFDGKKLEICGYI